MNKKAKLATVALSAVFACGLFASCDLVTTDPYKDYQQVVAEVDITKGEDFAQGGKYNAYASVIDGAKINKRDMVANFVSSGYNAMNSQGWSYEDTFKAIIKNLTERQIYIQYAKVFLLENGDAEGNTYTVEGYNAATAGDNELADLDYFLTASEKAQALYATRVLFNNSLDSQEKIEIDKINKKNDDEASTETARTTPTGVNTANNDYCDEAYRVYTGYNSASACGSYKTQKGSTSTTRVQAYTSFLTNLRMNALLANNEDTSDVENLSYFKTELRSRYETALIQKLADCFEKEAEKVLTADWVQGQYDDTYEKQSQGFDRDVKVFESALDGISDTNFVLTAPEENYGYVINILLPFSTAQKATLNGFGQDYGDPKGNSFVQRAGLLKNVLATDQRASWFTGSEDYSFDATSASSSVDKSYNAGDADRKYLFFEDSLVKDYANVNNDADFVNTTDQYQTVKNYYGRYTYNGSVTYYKEKDAYRLQPNKIDIDGFIDEMEGYLAFAGLTVSDNCYVSSIDEAGNVTPVADNKGYYNRSYSDFYAKKGETVDYNRVDYSTFVYYAGKVDFANGYDANKIFETGSKENTAFSVINELSFAYNTDTAGLNPYLGYSVVTGKTSYMSEFEYAAQWACKKGAGTYVVAPTDYGWHIIYCTFSFVKNDQDEIKPFTFDFDDVSVKGTFSNLYYEKLKSTVVNTYTTNKQTEIVNSFSNDSCVTTYESRYEDLLNIGS